MPFLKKMGILFLAAEAKGRYAGVDFVCEHKTQGGSSGSKHKYYLNTGHGT
jgi:hypothetical protein